MKKILLGLFFIVSIYGEPLIPTPASSLTNINLALMGEMLYMTPQEGGLFYAQTGRGAGTVTDQNENEFDGKIARLKGKWDFGFRVGVRYTVESNRWVLFSNWVHFLTSSKNGVVSPLIVLTGHSNVKSENLAQSPLANGVWHFHYNSFNLNLGYPFFVSNRLMLNPFFGARGAIFKQKISLFYDYEALPVDYGRVIMHSNFVGGGLTAGCSSFFHFTDDFGIYLVGSFALLYGKFKTPMSTYEDADLIFLSHDWYYTSVPNLNIETGLEWSHSFKNSYSLALKCGWNAESWYRVVKFTHFMHYFSEGKMYKEKGDLLLQGLVASIQFGF